MPLDNTNFAFPAALVGTEQVRPEARVVDDAIRLLERDGWCQDAMSRGGRHCLLGALLADGKYQLPVYGSAMRRAEFDLVLGELTRWNDRRGRTVGEVLSVLRRARDRLAERGR